MFLSFIGKIIFMFSKPLCFYLNQSILFLIYFIDRLYFTRLKTVTVMFYLLFHISFKALLVDVFTERINLDYFVQKLYNVDDISDEDSLLLLLKGLYLELAEHHINFTIFCSPNNTRRILKQVN